MALGEEDTIAARCACARMRASSSRAASLSTSESSSASRSVETTGDTGLPWPSAAPARISWPIGSAISRPTPNASSTESDSSTAPDQRNTVQASRSGPSTSDRGAQAATRQPVSMRSGRHAASAVPRSRWCGSRPRSCRRTGFSGLLGHRPAEEFLAPSRVRAMLMFLRSATAASHPGGRLSPCRISISRSGSSDMTSAYSTSLRGRTGTLTEKIQRWATVPTKRSDDVGLTGLARDARQVGLAEIAHGRRHTPVADAC